MHNLTEVKVAIIKIKFARYVETLAQYVMKSKSPEDPVWTYNCYEKCVADDFDTVRSVHGGRGEVNVIHVMQSWNEAESNTLTPEEFNAMGRALTAQYFPEHAYAVVTHTDTPKIHNHILVCPWNSDTGKKVENKKYHLYKLREISDRPVPGSGIIGH